MLWLGTRRRDDTPKEMRIRISFLKIRNKVEGGWGGLEKLRVKASNVIMSVIENSFELRSFYKFIQNVWTPLKFLLTILAF